MLLLDVKGDQLTKRNMFPSKGDSFPRCFANSQLIYVPLKNVTIVKFDKLLQEGVLPDNSFGLLPCIVLFSFELIIFKFDPYLPV